MIEEDLDGVGVRGLAQDLQQGWVRHKEEAREDKSFLLQVAGEGFLAELQLFQQVWQQLAQCLIPHTTLYHIWHFVSLVHDLHPGLVDTLEPPGFLQDASVCGYIISIV